MELAGIVKMGVSQELHHLDRIKYLLVEACEQQSGKKNFVVFTKLQDTVVPGIISAESRIQSVAATPNHTASEASAVKQTTITDFFSPDTTSPKLEDVATKKKIDPVKRSGRDSVPGPVNIGQNRSVSDTSNEETLIGNPDQRSDPSSPAAPAFGTEEVPSKLTTVIEVSDTLPVEDAKRDETEHGVEKYWIKQDEERLQVIAHMEKMMAEMEEKFANTTKFCQSLCVENSKLQAELDRKTTSLWENEEDRIETLHSLDISEMDNELVNQDLALERKFRNREHDRAEEALSLLELDPTKEVVAKLLCEKNNAISSNILQQRLMDSEMDSLNSQLKERCDAVARLTETLSRVADYEQWQGIMDEMDMLSLRVQNLPNELQTALLGCEEWKGKYDSLLLEKDHLRDATNSELIRLTEEHQRLMERATKSHRAYKRCLKQVFERMVRCTLCLESDGYLPFDNQHKAVCEQVLRLTGKNWERALTDYYDDSDHDIREEFPLKGNDDEDDYEGGHGPNNGGQAQNEEHGRQETNKEYGETIVTKDDDNVMPTTATEGEVQESSETQRVLGNPEFSHTEQSPRLFPVAAEQAMSTGTDTSITTQDLGGAILEGNEVEAQEETIAQRNEKARVMKPDLNQRLAQSEPIFASMPASNDPEVRGAFPFGLGKNSPPFLFTTPTATAGNDPFPPVATPAADVEAKSTGKSPIFQSFVTLQAEAKTPAIFVSQPSEFKFGETGPVSFTASSSSFQPQVTRPESNGIFSLPGQTSPSVTTQSKGKTVEGGVVENETPKEEVTEEIPEKKTSEVNIPEDEFTQGKKLDEREPTEILEEKSASKEGAPKEETREEGPALSTLSRNQKRAAKRQQKKAVKKAEREACRSKAEESRRVEQAMMMR